MRLLTAACETRNSAAQPVTEGVSYGGALYVQLSPSLFVKNSQFFWNTAEIGGGAYIANSQASIFM